MYGLELITAPTHEPVTLGEAKRHLGQYSSHEDADIDRHITAARQYAEIKTGRQILAAQWEATFDYFPKGKRALQLPKGAFRSLDSITWYDAELQPTSLDPAAAVRVFGPKDYPRLHPVDVWPTAYKVEIVWTCGLADQAAEVPAGLRNAILLMVGHYYDNRLPVVQGVSVSEVPATIDTLFHNWMLGTEFLNFDPASCYYRAGSSYCA